jgi:hypothetical protein
MEAKVWLGGLIVEQRKFPGCRAAVSRTPFIRQGYSYDDGWSRDHIFVTLLPVLIVFAKIGLMSLRVGRRIQATKPHQSLKHEPTWVKSGTQAQRPPL